MGNVAARIGCLHVRTCIRCRPGTLEMLRPESSTLTDPNNFISTTATLGTENVRVDSVDQLSAVGTPQSKDSAANIVASTLRPPPTPRTSPVYFGRLHEGCKDVFLDVGANIGVQIRKLFEPELYPAAKMHRKFDKWFGDANPGRRKTTCVIGFEPNPKHEHRLRKLVKFYVEQGLGVLFFMAAVSNVNGTAQFMSNNSPRMEAGSIQFGNSRSSSAPFIGL